MILAQWRTPPFPPVPIDDSRALYVETKLTHGSQEPLALWRLYFSAVDRQAFPPENCIAQAQTAYLIIRLYSAIMHGLDRGSLVETKRYGELSTIEDLTPFLRREGVAVRVVVRTKLY